MSLINDITQVRSYVPIAAASTLDTIPDIDAAEQAYILPIIGQDLYDELQAAFTDGSLTAKQQLLIEKIRAVTVPFAYVEDMGLLQVMMTDAGLIAMENTGARKPWKWEYNNAMEALMTKGYAAQERLILFLKLNKADYTEWETSPYNDPEGFMIIRDGTDLRGLLGLAQPHRVYMSIRPILLGIAEEILKPTLSTEYYTALNGRIEDDTLTDADKEILPRLRMYCARMAMVQASTTQNVKVGDNKFTVVDTRIKDTIDEGAANANDVELSRFRNQHEKSAINLLNQVKAYMNDKASETVFVEFFNSAVYTPPPVPYENDNSKYKGMFRM